jgi:nitrite reductase/ring-hydroxylating ferredoxin subunit
VRSPTENSVVCPWHRSEFALGDGAVINGPATSNQSCFDIRERDGQIEIRAREGTSAV